MTYTHITMVVDRSGSMAAVQSDAEGAINHFLKEQKKVNGECSLILVEFDGPPAQDWYNQVFEGDLQEFPVYILTPRANTALFDAVGMAIAETDTYCLEHDPEKVIFVIQTDGQENSSKEWKLDRLQETIKDHAEWEFVYLGMGPDTFEQGHQMGIQNIVRSSNTGVAHGHTHTVLSAYAADYRTGHTHNMSAANVRVTAEGRVFDGEGFEIDPDTGQRI